MLYALKDADRQARLEKETFGSFSATLQAYFIQNNKKLSDLRLQKTVSIDCGNRRVQLKPGDIIQIHKRNIKADLADEIALQYGISTHMAYKYAMSLRPCMFFTNPGDGIETHLCYLMKIVDGADKIQTIALDPDQVIKQD